MKIEDTPFFLNSTLKPFFPKDKGVLQITNYIYEFSILTAALQSLWIFNSHSCLLIFQENVEIFIFHIVGLHHNVPSMVPNIG